MKCPDSKSSAIFFSQAEDGIRDKLVTGVQTCALPISNVAPRAGVIAVAEGPRQTVLRAGANAAQKISKAHKSCAKQGVRAGRFRTGTDMVPPCGRHKKFLHCGETAREPKSFQ